MSVEAIKARVGVNAPSADFQARRDTLRLLSPSRVPQGHPQPWAADHVFHISDAGQEIMVRISATLRYTGQRAARFTLWGALRTSVVKPASGLLEMVGTQPGPTDILLQPGESIHGYWEVTRTLAEWIAIYDQRVAGDPGPENELTAFVDDGYDGGAFYWFTLLLGGTVVEPSSAGFAKPGHSSPPTGEMPWTSAAAQSRRATGSPRARSSRSETRPRPWSWTAEGAPPVTRLPAEDRPRTRS